MKSSAPSSGELRQCSASASSFYGNCERKATAFRDGVPFCWQHDPRRREKSAAEKRAAQREADKKTEAEFEEKCRLRRLRERAGLTDLTEAEMEALAALGGIRAILAELSKCNGI